MSRLTGKEVYSLMEAYQAVYTPQELTEEQVWEGVENWVHSLLEEGYDLSDYTWEEMYGEYIIEIGGISDRNRPGQQSTTSGSVTTYAQPRPNTGEPTQSRFARPMNAGTPQRTGRATAVSRPPVASLPSSARQVTQYPQGVPTGVGGGNAGASIQAPASRPSPTSTPSNGNGPKVIQRPGAPAPSNGNGPKVIQRPGAPTPRPATTPDSKMGGDPMDQWARANPTLAAKVKPGQSGYNTVRTRLDADNDRQENYDAYDLVLSHLINEGYADTQEAALAIMGNMSEDWKQSIVEAKADEDLTPLQKIRNRNRSYFKGDENELKKTTTRRQELSTKRGVKKERGSKSAFGTMKNIGGPYS